METCMLVKRHEFGGMLEAEDAATAPAVVSTSKEGKVLLAGSIVAAIRSHVRLPVIARWSTGNWPKDFFVPLLGHDSAEVGHDSGGAISSTEIVHTLWAAIMRALRRRRARWLLGWA